jgi:hypothetical protein
MSQLAAPAQRLVAMCGIICTECPAYLATQSDDEVGKAKCASMWSTAEFPLKAEDIHCDGCAVRGQRVVSFCEVCDVRNCGLGRNLTTCAACADYPCDKLARAWSLTDSAGKAMLEQIRSGKC